MEIKNKDPEISATLSLCHQIADVMMAIIRICPRLTALNTWRRGSVLVDYTLPPKEPPTGGR